MRYIKEIEGNVVVFSGNVLRTDSGDTIVNPTHEQLVADGWTAVDDPEPTAEELLAEAKRQKVEAIMARDGSSEVNEFYLAGQPMWLDAATRQQLRISIDAYQATGAQTVTKWFGGQQFTFPTTAWLQMLNALEVYAAEALNVTEAHVAAVSALESVESVEAYDYTAGYPTKLNLSTEWLAQQS